MAHKAASDLVMFGVPCEQTELGAVFFVTWAREAAVDVCTACAQLLGDCEIVRVLHAAGADLKRGTSDGKPEGTPYALAFRQGRRDVVEYLQSCFGWYPPSLGRGRARLPEPYDGPEFESCARVITSPPSSPQPKQSRPKRLTAVARPCGNGRGEREAEGHPAWGASDYSRRRAVLVRSEGSKKALAEDTDGQPSNSVTSRDEAATKCRAEDGCEQRRGTSCFRHK